MEMAGDMSDKAPKMLGATMGQLQAPY
jgi:hypothetical protein